ncbi:hypothetical protein H6501_04165 [Candidatus Woesearchaeota archaeon]|nr:hypothetical protein [Candidatus Woesearchaeota archaeon]USN43843.1 MAG: hypothetical protein H6500_05640 [Candidatus Woesearchaeota archaeon]
MKKKKAISPIIGTALLLVATIAAVVGFKIWFTSLSTGIHSDLETKTASTNNLDIENLVGAELYITNKGTTNESMKELLINGQPCVPSTELDLGVTNMDISSCIKRVNKEKIEISMITEKNILSKEYFIDLNAVHVKMPSQVWVNTYDQGTYSDDVLGLAVDSNDDVYMASRPRSASNNQDWDAVKFLSNGSYEWNDLISNGVYYEGTEGIKVYNDDAYVVGILFDAGVFKLAWARYNTSGSRSGPYFNYQGVNTYGTAIDVRNDFVYVGGYLGGSGGIFLAKYDLLGNLIWEKNYTEATKNALLWGLKVNSQEEIYAVGHKDNLGNRSFVVKFNSTGSEVWNYSAKLFFLDYYDCAWDVTLDNQENVYAVAYSLNPTFTETVGLLMKFDPDGNQIFNISLPTNSSVLRHNY